MHASDAEHVHDEDEDEVRAESQVEDSPPREGGGPDQRRPRRRGRRGGRRGRSGGGRERGPGETATAGEAYLESDRSETPHQHAEPSRGRSDDAGPRTGPARASRPRSRNRLSQARSRRDRRARSRASTHRRALDWQRTRAEEEPRRLDADGGVGKGARSRNREFAACAIP
jgi:hypothetical protein